MKLSITFTWKAGIGIHMPGKRKHALAEYRLNILKKDYEKLSEWIGIDLMNKADIVFPGPEDDFLFRFDIHKNGKAMSHKREEENGSIIVRTSPRENPNKLWFYARPVKVLIEVDHDDSLPAADRHVIITVAWPDLNDLRRWKDGNSSPQRGLPRHTKKAARKKRALHSDLSSLFRTKGL